ncbi:MAG: T9SS type A sorting domain-containing protein [Bacteroidales bacterium]|jgi:hypothetical protein
MKKTNAVSAKTNPLINKTCITLLSAIFLISFNFFSYAQCPTGYIINGTNQVANCSFSLGNVGFTSQYTYEMDQDLHSECWAEGTYSVVPCAYDVHPSWSHNTKPVGDSSYFMVVNGNKTANVKVWEENITVFPNTVYFFTTWVCSVHPLNPAQLQFLVGNLTIGSIFTASADTNNHWLQFYATWNSGTHTTADISIINKNTIANGNDFGLDNIFFVPCSLSLPVELLTFQVNCIDNTGVEIYWATASETNNAYFNVECSTDAENWVTIATVQGAGNSNEPKYYSVKNNQYSNSAAYYRLKQTDFNGNYKYYDWKYADCAATAPTVQFIPDNDPNSNIMHINIKNFTCHSAQMKVYDVLGRMVYSRDVEDINTNYSFDVDFNFLSNAHYFIQFVSHDYNNVYKILKF